MNEKMILVIFNFKSDIPQDGCIGTFNACMVKIYSFANERNCKVYAGSNNEFLLVNKHRIYKCTINIYPDIDDEYELEEEEEVFLSDEAIANNIEE